MERRGLAASVTTRVCSVHSLEALSEHRRGETRPLEELNGRFKAQVGTLSVL